MKFSRVLFSFNKSRRCEKILMELTNTAFINKLTSTNFGKQVSLFSPGGKIILHLPVFLLFSIVINVLNAWFFFMYPTSQLCVCTCMCPCLCLGDVRASDVSLAARGTSVRHQNGGLDDHSK